MFLAGVLFLLTQFVGCVRQQPRPVLIKTMSVETELYLIDEFGLVRVMPAISDFLDRGETVTADKILRETLAGEPFQALQRTNPVLADYFAHGSRDLLDGKLPEQAMDDTTGEITRNPEVIRRRRTEVVLARFLVLFWCARHSHEIPVGITLNRGALADYIRGRSKWIDEMISLSNEFLWRAPDLKPPIGGDAKLLTQDQAATLLNALLEITAPTDSGLRSQYESLKLLLKTAVDNQRYRILICTG
jgi:hypothetical protein